MAEKENIIEDLDTLLEQGDDSKNLWPNIKGHGIDWSMPDKEDWEFLKDAGRFWGALPTETGGILKNFMDRGGGSPLLGALSFYASTFGKPEWFGGDEGEITVPFDQIQSNDKLSTYLENMREPHLRNNADEIKNQEKIWNDQFWDMVDKYNIEVSDDPAGVADRLRMAMAENKEEGKEDLKKLYDLQNDYNLSLSPYIINDENQDQIPESITFKEELFSDTPMEPNVHFINKDTISFPYLGPHSFNEEGQFTMQHPSVFKPLDQPGYEDFLDELPGGEVAQKWQEYVTPEYSPEPELFRKPGWVMGGMGPLALSTIGPLAWKGAKWAGQKVAPYASKLSRANPYIAGIMTALQAGKAEAPGVVPEGVEATPENLEKYGKIAKEKGLLGWQ
jgi:hypothetical protein